MHTHLQSERLQLRPPTLKDAQPIYRGYAADPEVTRYLSWLPHRHQRETRGFLGMCIKAWDEGTDYTWVIEKRENQELLGMVGMTPYQHRFHTGYVLKQAAWGKGYATEALQTLLPEMLKEPGVFRVEAMCYPDNRSSARVMEKAGMEYEGRMRRYIIFPNISDQPCDVLLYAAVRE